MLPPGGATSPSGPLPQHPYCPPKGREARGRAESPAPVVEGWLGPHRAGQFGKILPRKLDHVPHPQDGAEGGLDRVEAAGLYVGSGQVGKKVSPAEEERREAGARLEVKTVTREFLSSLPEPQRLHARAGRPETGSPGHLPSPSPLRLRLSPESCHPLSCPTVMSVHVSYRPAPTRSSRGLAQKLCHLILGGQRRLGDRDQKPQGDGEVGGSGEDRDEQASALGNRGGRRASPRGRREGAETHFSKLKRGKRMLFLMKIVKFSASIMTGLWGRAGGRGRGNRRRFRPRNHCLVNVTHWACGHGLGP